jgi:hypothetical protein
MNKQNKAKVRDIEVWDPTTITDNHNTKKVNTSKITREVNRLEQFKKKIRTRVEKSNIIEYTNIKTALEYQKPMALTIV